MVSTLPEDQESPPEEDSVDPIAEDSASTEAVTEEPQPPKKKTKASDFPYREFKHLTLAIDDYKVFFHVAKLFPAPADKFQWALDAFDRANDIYEATVPQFIRLPYTLEYECVVSRQSIPFFS